MDVYKEQELYTDGFKAGYAQAIADADAELRKRGDDMRTRRCRRAVLSLAGVSYNIEEIEPNPDWSKRQADAPTSDDRS